MISIDKIIQHLQQCKDTSITIPKSNISKYVQKTAIDIRKDELSLLNTNFEKLNEANYTMDSEFDKLNKENEDIKHTIEDLHKSNTKETIPNKSLIIYNENEIANLPEIIITLINNNNDNNDFIDIEKLYLYGIKNPDSFYKSFLLLSKVDFIIKNKIDQKNDVATFKREMAVQYESFYKLLNYRKLKFSRHNMVTNLTNCDNYNDYDIFQYISDYTKNNFIILDIIEEKYIDVNYTNNDTNSDTNLIENLINNDEKQYFILIKYSANTFLPLMNNSGNHKFNVGILKYITKTYERLIFPKYKEPKDINLNNDDNDDNDDNNDNDKMNNTINSSSIKTYNIDDIEDVDNITESYSTVNIEEAFNNSIKLQTENSIIKKNNTFFNIEDMVDIEESEDITDDINKSQTEQDNNDNDNDNNDNNNDNNDVFDMLMNKIPIKSNNKKIKEPKVKSNTKNKTDTKTDTKTNTKTEFVKEELLPMAKYNLADLQRLSFLYKIEIQKMGTQGKKINKLKLELYEELTNAKKYSNF